MCGDTLGVGLESFYGQRVVEDTTGNPPNYCVLRTWSKTPSFTL